MKKNLFLIVLLLLLTGCTCKYNLTIDGSTYKEEVMIVAENDSEKSDLNYEWKIPIDKEEYNLVGDSSTTQEYSSDLYNYKLVGNVLTFNHDFSKSKYVNSTAVSSCYNKLTLLNHNNATILSTSIKAECFEKYPQLNNITINIKVDRDVISDNADEKNGKTYTWYIDKSSANNKSINLTLSNENTIIQSSSPSSSQEIKKETSTDYTFYIVLLILLILMITGYYMFKKMSQKNNQMDD